MVALGKQGRRGGPSARVTAVTSRRRHPTPEPLDTNEVAVVAIITGMWAVALVVLLLAGESLSPNNRWWIWTCAAGIGGGVVALAYLRQRRRGIEKRRHDQQRM